MSNPTKAEFYRKTLIVVDYVAFGKQHTSFFFDANLEQASNSIWRDICPTAVILFAWHYGIENPVQLKVSKKKLSDDELAKAYKGKDGDE